jgi:hypothetical protein
MFVSDLRQVGGFLRYPPPIKRITEILSKVKPDKPSHYDVDKAYILIYI